MAVRIAVGFRAGARARREKVGTGFSRKARSKLLESITLHLGDSAQMQRDLVRRRFFGVAHRLISLFGRRPAAAIDLTADLRDRPLIDGGGVPRLNRPEIAFARLIAAAGAPAMGVKEVCRCV